MFITKIRWIIDGIVFFMERSPFQMITVHHGSILLYCFLNDDKIPEYFYEHPITLTVKQKKEIKNRLGSINKLEIKGLDLHFDGHNGDHLLLYVKTNQNIIYLVGIGTHSDLF